MKYLGKITDNKDLVTKEYVDSLIALEYSTSSSYEVDDCVIYNGKLYKCNTAIPSGETWTPAHWTQTNVVDVIQESGQSTLTVFDPYESTYEEVMEIFEAHNNSFENCITITPRMYNMDDNKYAEIVDYQYSADRIRLTIVTANTEHDMRVNTDCNGTQSIQILDTYGNSPIEGLKITCFTDEDGSICYDGENFYWDNDPTNACVFVTDSNGTITLPTGFALNNSGGFTVHNLPYARTLPQDLNTLPSAAVIRLAHYKPTNSVFNFYYDRMSNSPGWEELQRYEIASKEYVNNSISGKQDTLVSGTNIKTINNQSVLGSGNITIETGTVDAIQYGTTTLTQLNTLYTKHNNSFEGCVVVKDNKAYSVDDFKKDNNTYIFSAVSTFNTPPLVVPTFQGAMDGPRCYVRMFDLDGSPLSGIKFIIKADDDGWIYSDLATTNPVMGVKMLDPEWATVFESNSQGEVPFYFTSTTTMEFMDIGQILLADAQSSEYYNTIHSFNTQWDYDNYEVTVDVYLENVNPLPAIIKKFQCDNGTWTTLSDVDISYESGVNIKTINNQSILGSGNINISGSVAPATTNTLGGVKLPINGDLVNGLVLDENQRLYKPVTVRPHSPYDMNTGMEHVLIVHGSYSSDTEENILDDTKLEAIRIFPEIYTAGTRVLTATSTQASASAPVNTVLSWEENPSATYSVNNYPNIHTTVVPHSTSSTNILQEGDILPLFSSVYYSSIFPDFPSGLGAGGLLTCNYSGDLSWLSYDTSDAGTILGNDDMTGELEFKDLLYYAMMSSGKAAQWMGDECVLLATGTSTPASWITLSQLKAKLDALP